MKLKSRARRLLVIPIVFSLFLGDATIIFAQEPQPSKQSIVAEEESTPAQAPQVSESQEIAPKSNGSESLLSGEEGDDSTPSYEREKAGLGRVSDPLNSYSGSYTYQIPLKIPPGRNGMAPDLTLSYSSQNHNENDIFGYGWQMSIPYIERYNKSGAGTRELFATSSTNFYSSISGELVPAEVGGVVPSLTTEKFYPTKDGSVYNIQLGTQSWAAARNASSGTTVYTTDGPLATTRGCDFDDLNDHMTRSGFVFDTSSIPSNNNISSAVLNTYITSWSVDDPLEGTSGSLVVTHPTISATGAVALSDYSQMSESLNNPQEGSPRFFIPYLPTSAYNQFVLNDLAEGWIGKGNGAVTKLGVRDTWDVDNTCGFVVDDWVHTRFSGYTGTNYDPYLTVTHIPPVEQYVARNDDGSALKYTFQNNTWTVTDKSGKTFFFGTSTDARQDDPSGTGKTYKWMLQEVQDANGNVVRYSYSKDSGQIYPSSITYTGTATTTGTFSVDFTKSLRNTSTATSTETGFNVKTRYKIDQVAAKFSGNTVHKYDFAYSAGDNGSRLVLSTITETGQQEGGGSILSLPASSFLYSSSTKGFTSSSWTIPNNIYSRFVDDNIDRGVILADVNGDGLADMVQAHEVNSTQYKEVNLNTGSGWSEDNNWTFPYCTFTKIGSYARDGSGRLADVNGDHLPDFLCNTSVFLNSGTTWQSTSTTWILPVSIADESGLGKGVKFADVNGDRLIDVLQSYKSVLYPNNSDYDKNFRRVYLNTGMGWQYDAGFRIPTDIVFGTYYVNSSYTENDIHITDVNNDGLADFIKDKDVYINTGSTWQLDPTWQMPMSTKGIGQRIFDISGDGLPDLISATSTLISGNFVWKSNKTYINTGTGWSLDNGRTMDNPFEINGQDTGARVADMNGDSLADVIYYGQGTAGQSWSYNTQQVSQGMSPDLMKTTNESSGKVITITYKATPQYRDGSNNMLNPSLPFAVTTVQSINYYDGLATSTKETYEYKDGDFYFASSTERRFAGFEVTTRIDGAGNISKLFYHQGNNTASTSGEYSDDQSKIGRVYRGEERDGSGNLYSLSVNKWESTSRGGLGNFVQLTRSTTLDYGGDADHKDKSETYSYSTTTGNLTQKIEWGEVTGSNDGSFTDSGSDKRTTDITYAASTTGYLILPSNQTVTDQSSNKITETKFYYDSLSLGSVNKGNLTKQENWKSSSNYINTQKTYNSYGLVTQSTDPRGKITTYTYDSHNLYPATTTNPLSQSTGYTYDYSSGKVTQTIDPNGNIFQAILDPLDRITEEKQPDLTTPSTLVTKATYTYTDNTMPRVIQKTLNLDGSTSTASYTFLDGFGRKVEERSRAEDTNTYSVKDYSYDFRGNLKNESLPFFGTGTSYSGSVPSSNLLINYTYDPLKRVASIVNSVGTTTNGYDDWKLTVTDPNGKVKHLYKDAYGRLIKVEEINGGTTYTTNYEYNGNNNLIKITDADVNIRNFTYDGLGRRLTAQDLHDQADGTYGTWTYVYDDAGNIASSTDPKSQIVEYTYDDLSRVLTENYTGQGGTEISYGYDFCALGKGKLCAATTTDAVTKLEYNSLGLVKKETRTINSTDYVTQYGYNRLSAPTSVIYPDNSEIAYTYNSGSLLEKVEQKENGGTFKGIVDDLDYAPTGKITFKDFGNGVTSVYTYDADKLYRLTNILTTASSTEAGGGLGFLSSPNFKKLFADIGGISTNPFSLLAFNSSSRLAIEALSAPLSEEQNTGLTTDNPAIVEIIKSTPDADLIAPVLLEEAATSTVASEPVSTTTEPIASSTSALLDLTGTTTIFNLESVSTSTATSTATTTDLLATSTVETLEVATSTATSTELVDETLKVKDGKAGKFTDNDDNYEFVFSQKNKNAGKASAKALKDKSEIRLTKWDGQVDIGVSYKKVKGNGLYKSSGDRIEWKDSKEELHAYPLPATKETEDGGFEIEVYLKDKPDANVFDFEIDGAQNLDFFYQPELTQEEIDEGAIRPENVVGSYAVYHKTKKNYEVGGMNYETGKVFHIFRPKAIDASGNEVWGTLSYEKGVLSVTVPQDFLDGAEYPVRVDPTFGYMTAGASGSGYDYSTASDAALGDEYNLPVAGTIQSITAHAGPFNSPSGTNARFIVTSGGLSGTLQGVSAGFLNESSSRVWTTKNLTSPLSLSSGNYILGFQGDNREVAMSYDTASGQVYQINTTADFSASPGSSITWSNSASVDRKFSIYATYTTDQSNWQYRKSLTLNGASGAGSNYQVLLKVGESSGASGEDFDLGSHAQSFPTVEGSSADMMFTGEDGSTQLSHWVEDVTGTSPNRLAYVWVKVSDDLSTNKNIYVYYGNAGTLKTSNGVNTFNFFDNFDDGAINGQKWTTICSSGCNIAGGSSSSVTETGDSLKQFDAAIANSQGRVVATSSPFNTDGYAIKRRFRRVDNGTYANSSLGFASNLTSHTDTGTTSPLIHNANFENKVDFIATGVSNSVLYASDLTQNTWYREESRRTSATQVAGQLWTDAHSSLASVSTTTSSVTDNEYPALRSGDGHDVETDWVFVRRFESTEPTYSSAGSEEYLGQGGSGGYIGVIQNISFTYDSVGNITQMTDYSSTGAGKLLSLTYDDLHRLTFASTTAASSTPFIQRYTYSPIGNMSEMRTGSGATSTYTYAETGLTNPHAPTSIAGTSLTYDNNGNLIAYGAKSYEWDYRNRLASSTESGANTIYKYDHTEQRVKKTNGATTTLYPNKYYETTGATSTRYIWAGDELVATISGGTSTTTSYIHPDHLGSTNAVTSELGYVVKTLDYYPYGSERIATGTPEVSRTFIGQHSDSESDLSYLNARYYEGSRGQFLSQDAVFWEIDKTPDGKKVLTNPQAQNSYSYARNNPIINKDPTGRAAYIWDNGAGMTGIDTWDTNTYYQYQDRALLQNNATQMNSSGNYANLGAFYERVRNGAEWDYKNQSREYYFYGDELIDKEAFGNRNYGYAGTAGGFGKNTLKAGAGYAQIRSGNVQLKNFRTYFDDPRDTGNIQIGISSYSSSNRPNPASAGQIASQTALNSQTLRAISQQLQSIQRQLSNIARLLRR